MKNKILALILLISLFVLNSVAFGEQEDDFPRVFSRVIEKIDIEIYEYF